MNRLAKLGLVYGVLIWGGALNGLIISNADAGEVAVICADDADLLPANEAVSARVRNWAMKKQLESRYDRVDFMACRSSTDVAVLVNRLESRARKHRTDFFDIRLEMSQATLRFDEAWSSWVQKWILLGNSFEKLRVALVRDSKDLSIWQKTGAEQSIQIRGAGVEMNQRAWLMKWVQAWNETRNGFTATQESNRLLDDITKPITDLISPRLTRGIQSSRAAMGARLFSVFALPGARLGSHIDGVPQLIDRAAGPAWEILKTTFPHPIQGIPGRIDEELPEGELVWIDGDGLKYFLSPLKEWLGPEADSLLRDALGMRLVRQASGLHAALYFRESKRMTLTQLGLEIPDGELKAVVIPRTLRLSVSIQDGVARLRFLPVVDQPLAFEVSWKGFPLLLEPKGARADLTTGDSQVEATVLGGWVRFSARLNLFEKRFDGIDFWESMSRKGEKFRWPSLRFVEER